MTHYAAWERQQLCDTFERVGPDAPTLCGDWSTADLAAHLVIRERRPDAAGGILVPALQARLERVQAEYLSRPWAELVDLVRTGPPAWSPTRLSAVGEVANLGELFVHHEDVLRAGEVTPRELDPQYEHALWQTTRRAARLLLRKARTGVVLVTEEGRRAVKGPTDLGTVVVRGRPAELALFAFGRQNVAQVDLQGTPDAVTALLGSPIGPG